MANFAHPIERELARVFDEHGIAWEYEPRTCRPSVADRPVHGKHRSPNAGRLVV